MLDHLHRESGLTTFSWDIKIRVLGQKSNFCGFVRCAFPNADGPLLALNPNLSLAHGEENLPQQMSIFLRSAEMPSKLTTCRSGVRAVWRSAARTRASSSRGLKGLVT